jgi:glutathione S-transferase
LPVILVEAFGVTFGTMSADSVPVLWHLKPSHFNEKARWALDYKCIPHRREAPFPGTHIPIALRLTRRSITFPVLQIDGKTIGDSTEIIAELERRVPDPPLYPEDPEARRRALELEDYFDEHLGPDVRVVGFWHLVSNPEYVPVGGAKGRFFTVMVRRRYSLTEQSAARSLLQVRACMRLIEELLGGSDHLVGESFTVADLTAAALLGPLVRAPQFPYGSKTPVAPSFEEISSEMRALPAGQWALRTYERYRPPSAEIDGGEPDRPPLALVGVRG